MPDLQWSKDPPKVAGWYWRKVNSRSRRSFLVAVRVSPHHQAGAVVVEYRAAGRSGSWWPVKGGRWAGPIPQPKEPSDG